MATGSELEALRREVERLRVASSRDSGLLDAVLRESPHGIIVCDAQGRLVLQNRAAERIWCGSASAEGVADWGRYRAFHADGRPYAPSDWSMARCLSTGSVVEAEEVRFQRFDGSFGVLLGSCAPIRGAEGELEGAVSIFADISRFKEIERERGQLQERLEATIDELKRANEEARAAWARAEASRADLELLFTLTGALNRAPGLGEVFDAALDAIATALHVQRAAILLTDAGGVMRFAASRGLSEAYRAAVEGLSPWPKTEPAPAPRQVPDVGADPSLRSLAPLLERERIGALVSLPLLHGDRLIGKFMVYEERQRRFTERDLQIGQTIATHVASAVARKRAMQERERLIDQLSRTVQWSEMVSAILAHDLRSPLSAILTSAQTVLSRPLPEPSLRALGRVVSSGERMARMIDQLLDFTRIRVGNGISLDVREANLAEICHHVADELAAARPGIPLAVEVSGDATGEWDPDRLAQVVSNLAGNAVEHGALDRATLHVDGSSADRVRLRVHNRGAVPVALLPVLFEPFKGVGKARERSSGLGLGLHITQKIVHAHGGTVKVDSSEEDGTTVTVELPRRATHARAGYPVVTPSGGAVTTQ